MDALSQGAVLLTGGAVLLTMVVTWTGWLAHLAPDKGGTTAGTVGRDKGDAATATGASQDTDSSSRAAAGGGRIPPWQWPAFVVTRVTQAVGAYNAEHARLLRLVDEAKAAAAAKRVKEQRAQGKDAAAVAAEEAARDAREAAMAKLWFWQRWALDETTMKVFAEFKQMEVRYVVPATVISLLLALLNVMRPYVTGSLVDVMATGASMSDAWPVLWRLVIVQLATWVSNILTGILFASARWNMVVEGRKRFFTSMLRQDLSFFDMERSSELTSRLAQEPDRMHQIVNHSLEKILKAVLNVCAGVVMAFAVDWQLAIVGIVVRAPFFVAFARRGLTIVQKYGRAQGDAMNAANRIASDALSDIVGVQSNVAEQAETVTYVGHLNNYLSVVRHTFVSETVLRYAQQAVQFTEMLVVTGAGVYQVTQGRITIGEYTAFNSYLQSYLTGATEIKNLLVQLRTMAVSCERYFALRDRVPLIPTDEGETCKSASGVLRLESVSFAYPTRPDRTVLHDLTAEVRPGQVLALVGPSGSGKSTCVRLCERFYDPTAGRVTLDGRDIREFDVRSYRRHIGYVPQEPTLYDRSVFDNIAYGMDPAPSVEQVQTAARDANAHDFICELPEGYNTLVGERGSRLSGGQRQRISIARAIVRDPQILLLDEATSSLDVESERLVHEALGRLMRGRSTVVIAHRLSTVRKAQTIAVIADGHVIERGTHEELLRKAGKYASFIRDQLVDLGPVGDEEGDAGDGAESDGATSGSGGAAAAAGTATTRG